MYLLAIIFIVIGVIFLVRPDWIFLVSESWKHSDETEPSSLYKLSIRIGGTMFTLIGLVLLIAL